MQAAPQRRLRPLLVQAGVSLAATAIILGLALRAEGLSGALRAAAAGSGPHLPRLELLAVASPAIQLHVAGVLAALTVGAVLLSGVKGTRVHRTLGWGWVAAMATVAVSSLFIRQINAGGFSLLHLFSGWTLVALPIGVVAARRHKVRMHGRMMTGLFTGGLIVAGVVAFMPGRLMWRMFFG